MDWRQLTKEDCGKEMTREESRQIQIDMLDALAAFCDANGLRYFLSGGTLIGAIRHKGFIPWDDDIDVNMPRPDCERLYKLTGGRLNDYVIAGPDMDGFSRCCGFYRMYNFNIVIENFMSGTTRKNPIYHPIFIDIFPIEGLPDSEVQTKWHYCKIVALRKMQRSSSLKHLEAKNIFAHLFHIISAVPAKLIGYRRWSRMIQRVANKYSFEQQKYVGVMTAPVHTTNEKVIKDDYMRTQEVLFEGKYYHAPGNYDVYLRQLYGEYLTMPPVEKQRSHHEFLFYWREK